MPRHNDRRKLGKHRRDYEVLDWWAEDPWAEPGMEVTESEANEDWGPGSWSPADDDDAWGADETLASRSEDPFEDWSPVRRRRTRKRNRA